MKLVRASPGATDPTGALSRARETELAVDWLGVGRRVCVYILFIMRRGSSSAHSARRRKRCLS